MRTRWVKHSDPSILTAQGQALVWEWAFNERFKTKGERYNGIIFAICRPVYHSGACCRQPLQVGGAYTKAGLICYLACLPLISLALLARKQP